MNIMLKNLTFLSCFFNQINEISCKKKREFVICNYLKIIPESTSSHTIKQEPNQHIRRIFLHWSNHKNREMFQIVVKMFVFLIYFHISSTCLFLYFNYLKILFFHGSGKMLAFYTNYTAAESNVESNLYHHHHHHEASQPTIHSFNPIRRAKKTT